MMERTAGWHRPLAAAAATTLVAGCFFPGGGSGTEGRPTGRIVLTTRGAQSTLQGDPASVAGSVEEVFRVLDITLTRRDVNESGGEVIGQSGLDRVFVDISTAGDGRSDVDVRVRTAGNQWDRAAARGILAEMRRWQAS